jgi:hypothetical protein
MTYLIFYGRSTETMIRAEAAAEAMTAEARKAENLNRWNEFIRGQA